MSVAVAYNDVTIGGGNCLLLAAQSRALSRSLGSALSSVCLTMSSVDGDEGAGGANWGAGFAGVVFFATSFCAAAGTGFERASCCRNDRTLSAFHSRRVSASCLSDSDCDSCAG